MRRGGTAVIVGVGPMTENMSINALMGPLSGKILKGCFYGNTNPKVDFPGILEMYQLDRLNLDDMVTKIYTISLIWPKLTH